MTKTVEKDKHIARLEEVITAYQRKYGKLSATLEKFADAYPSLECALSALRDEPLSSGAAVKVGELCFKLGFRENARHYFQKAIASDHRNSDALNNMGVIHVEAGEFSLAEQYFVMAAEINPRNIPARKNLSLLYDSMSDDEKTHCQNKVMCPCCQGQFPAFLPFGKNNPRPNALCPKCGSLERHRLLLLYLKGWTEFFRARLKVLHFAPEKALQDIFSRLNNIVYVSADLNSPLAMIHMDIRDITFGDKTFDLIICSHVLEHVADDRRAISEMFRVVKPGGCVMVQIPVRTSLEKTFEDSSIVSPEGRQQHFGQSDHVRVYGRDCIDRLKGSGFIAKEWEFPASQSGDQTAKYGLLPDDIIYLCIRQDFKTQLTDMKAYWNACAMDNAMKHIAIHDWENEEIFHRSGQESAEVILSLVDGHFFESVQGHGRMLDIGCGIGRMLKPFAQKFPGMKIYGVDVSEEMVHQGKQRMKEFQHVTLTGNNGKDLSMFDDNFFHFIYSYIVFQHIPRTYVRNYFREVNRVLDDTGLFVFQMQIMEGESRLSEPPGRDFRSIRYYSHADVKLLCSSHGLEIVHSNPALPVEGYCWYVTRKHRFHNMQKNL